MKKWWEKGFILSTFEATGHLKLCDIEECKKRLVLTKEAGFDLFEITWKTPETAETILNACEELGLPVILEDAYTNGKMSDPLWARDACSVEKLLQTYKNYNCIKGVYLWDEPEQQNIGICAEMAEKLRKLNKKILPFFALMPSYGPYTFKNGLYTEYVNRFIEKVDPEVLSFDYYCFWQHCINNPVIRNPLWKDMGFWRKRSLETGKPFWWYFQGINFGPDISEKDSYKNITVAHWAFQMYSALCYGVKGLSCYNSYGSILNMEGEKTHLYEDVKELNRRIKNIGNELFGSKSIALYHTGLCNKEEKDYYINKVQNNPYFISDTKQIMVGVFEKNGLKNFMVVNKNYKTGRNISIRFNRQKSMKAFGNYVNFRVNKEGYYCFHLNPGEGVLFF